MGRYYNKTRGPLGLSLLSGKAASVPPKTWVELDPADEGSPSVINYIRKGFLHRAPDRPEPEVEDSSSAGSKVKKRDVHPYLVQSKQQPAVAGSEPETEPSDDAGEES
jgi:hypothetical protein